MHLAKPSHEREDTNGKKAVVKLKVATFDDFCSFESFWTMEHTRVNSTKILNSFGEI